MEGSQGPLRLAVGVGFLTSPTASASPSTRLDPVSAVSRQDQPRKPLGTEPSKEVPRAGSCPASVFPAILFRVLTFAPLVFFP